MIDQAIEILSRNSESLTALGKTIGDSVKFEQVRITRRWTPFSSEAYYIVELINNDEQRRAAVAFVL